MKTEATITEHGKYLLDTHTLQMCIIENFFDTLQR